MQREDGTFASALAEFMCDVKFPRRLLSEILQRKMK
jgi:hypothetical protein